MLDPHQLAFGAADRGVPLPDAVRERMEALFGVDFGDVRVHLGEMPEALGAIAFAHGSDLYIEPEFYNPGNALGWQLIGHELAHVRQSLLGWDLAPEGLGVRLICSPSLEAEADRMGVLARKVFGARTLRAVPHAAARGPRRWDVVQALTLGQRIAWVSGGSARRR